MSTSINNVSKDLLYQLSQLVSKKLGLEFPENRHKDLLRGIGDVSRELGFDRINECIEWLVHSELNKQTLGLLVCHLTIGETYFFRDSGVFKFLKEEVLHHLIYSRWNKEKYLRIWSAACCTGEEPYSIAMLIDQLLPNRNQWNISIIGTDINNIFLEKAQKGQYTQWSFRNTPQSIRQKYFNKTASNRFMIKPAIKKMVHFFPLNLAELTYPNYSKNITEMDLVCCRNVLMYFSETIRDKVVQRLSKCMAQNGWLIISPGEAEHARKSGLISVRSSETTFFQKVNPQPSSFSRIKDHQEQNQLFGEFTSENLPQAEIILNKNNQTEINKPDEQVQEQWHYDDALLFFNKGSYNKSVLILTALLETEKNNAEYMALLARCYANLKQNDSACLWCEKAIQADSFNPSYYYLLASIQQEQGNIDKSIKSLNQTLYLEPNFIMAYMALGMIRRKQGRRQDFQKCVKNALYYLKNMSKNDIVASSDGMTAGRLIELLESMNND